MEATTGSQNIKSPGSSPLSAADQTLLVSLLHTSHLEPEEIDRISKGLQVAAAPRTAEEIVPEWEPDPPLLSDNQYPLGHGAEKFTVTIPIYGGDWYISELLPNLEEWISALYRGNSLDMFRLAQNNPIEFMIDVFKTIIGRPGRSRLKISFYEFCGRAFSNSGIEITAQFYAKCPPDQQLGIILKAVETNRANFTEFWAGLPILVRHETSLLYISSIQSIQSVRQTVISAMQSMTTEIQKSLTNGGHVDTGLEEFLALPTGTPDLIST